MVRHCAAAQTHESSPPVSRMPSGPSLTTYGWKAINPPHCYVVDTMRTHTEAGVHAHGEDIHMTSAANARIEALESRRLWVAGGLDVSFGEAGVRAERVGQDYSRLRHLAAQPDRRIVLAGEARPSADNTSTNVFVQRLRADGSLDDRFATNGVLFTTPAGFNRVFDAAVLADGRVYIAGARNGADEARVLRLTASGKLDRTFGRNGYVKLPVLDGDTQLALQSDGKILFAGAIVDTGGLRDIVLGRLTSDGLRDGAFAGGGVVTVSEGRRANIDFGEVFNHDVIGIASDSQGRAVVVSQSTFRAFGAPQGDSEFKALVTRVSQSGVIDATFGDAETPGTRAIGGLDASGLTIEPDGRVVVAIGSAGVGGALYRLTVSGRPDETFASAGSLSLPVGMTGPAALFRQADGKYLVAGADRSPGALPRALAVARVTTEGELDDTFNGDGV